MANVVADPGHDYPQHRGRRDPAVGGREAVHLSTLAAVAILQAGGESNPFGARPFHKSFLQASLFHVACQVAVHLVAFLRRQLLQEK